MNTETHIRKQYVFEELMNLRDVKNILGVSYAIVLNNIRDGFLPACKVTGQPIRRDEVGPNTYGLRVKPADLRDYLNSVEVR